MMTENKMIWEENYYDRDRVYDLVTELIKEKKCFGELGFGQNMQVDLSRIAVRYTDAEKVDKGVKLTFTILESPEGLILQSLIDGKVKMRPSVRGIGAIEDGKVDLQKLIAMDIVRLELE